MIKPGSEGRRAGPTSLRRERVGEAVWPQSMRSSLSFYPVGIAREDYRHLMGSHALPKPFPGFVAGCRACLDVCSNHLGDYVPIDGLIDSPTLGSRMSGPAGATRPSSSSVVRLADESPQPGMRLHRGHRSCSGARSHSATRRRTAAQSRAPVRAKANGDRRPTTVRIDSMCTVLGGESPNLDCSLPREPSPRPRGHRSRASPPMSGT